jgi:hypothetical protein
MDYQQAQKIRGKSFASIMTEKLAEGGGIGGSLRATVSERSQARMKGIKEKFDILNIAKMMTGGSNLAPAILGRMLGRSTRDIKYFANIKDKKTASKLGPIDNNGTSPEMISILEKIYNFLKETIDDDRLKKEQESQFAEEKELERMRRHKQLMEAITGKPYKNTYTKVKDEAEAGGILGDILGGFNSAKDLLKTVSKFFSSPIGSVMLAGAAAGLVGFAFIRFLTSVREQDKLERPQDYESVPYDVSKQTGETMGEVGQRQKGQAVKQVTPQYAKELLTAKPAFTDAELVEETGLTRTELEEELKKNPRKNIMVPIAPKVKPVGTTEQNTPEPVQQNTPTPAIPTESNQATPVQGVNVGQKLNMLQGENLMAKIDDKTEVGKAVTTNNVIKNSLDSSVKRGYIPSVRNQEETFQQMILYSTRVV